jgi:hypothetical protein
MASPHTRRQSILIIMMLTVLILLTDQSVAFGYPSLQEGRLSRRELQNPGDFDHQPLDGRSIPALAGILVRLYFLCLVGANSLFQIARLFRKIVRVGN